MILIRIGQLYFIGCSVLHFLFIRYGQGVHWLVKPVFKPKPKGYGLQPQRLESTYPYLCVDDNYKASAKS